MLLQDRKDIIEYRQANLTNPGTHSESVVTSMELGPTTTQPLSILIPVVFPTRICFSLTRHDPADKPNPLSSTSHRCQVLQ